MLDNKYQLNTEDLLNDDFSLEIHNFWQQHATTHTFDSEHEGSIHTVHIKTGNSQAIVICQGRNESVFKYKELAFDLSKQGYDIFLIDHRGQGLSSRLGGDLHRGHVHEFEHYVADLRYFVNSLSLQEHYQSCFLLAHSMGSAISALYLQEQSHPFHKVVFCSPMFSINTGKIPIWAAKLISFICDAAYSLFNELACYAPKVGEYQKGIFEQNELTSSEKRFNAIFTVFEQVVETQLGGPTMRWVNRSLYATEKAVKNAKKINIPVLLIQAGADTIVTKKGQQQFLANRSHCEESQLLCVEGAKHEILLEQDQYRIPALNQTLDFFKSAQQGKSTCIK
ncbi:alpha/beta fold hydrolase [Psychromonas sp. 14N.309.X.WAT.B.A12]|uniref:alpha/beta fold hydrolase n=1 Tax=Psychromonas sp. 14N.309.X.WAT.B.A12 TaxID=2998322 RepID=UPI0025B0FC13|nr:alpha/beta fold hydrolase [Psychromonas sp. 14N.309.X.WAT.B.A12]MDN2663293.1 alpha/beta fold hydrolase [Psychromonas sp. 14N.309.X.WAT.B.A12]